MFKEPNAIDVVDERSGRGGCKKTDILGDRLVMKNDRRFFFIYNSRARVNTLGIRAADNRRHYSSRRFYYVAWPFSSVYLRSSRPYVRLPRTSVTSKRASLTSPGLQLGSHFYVRLLRRFACTTDDLLDKRGAT